MVPISVAAKEKMPTTASSPGLKIRMTIKQISMHTRLASTTRRVTLVLYLIFFILDSLIEHYARVHYRRTIPLNTELGQDGFLSAPV